MILSELPQFRKSTFGSSSFIQGTSVAILIPLGLFIFKVSYQEAFTGVLQENSAIY